MQEQSVISFKNVSKTYQRSGGFFEQKLPPLQALAEIDLDILPGEIVGLVGESGSGKSTIARLALGLEPASQGEIFFRGRALSIMDKKQRAVFRKDVQMVFQDPFSSFNPKMTIFQAISEPLKLNNICSNRTQLKAEVVRLLDEVGISASAMDRYPYEFSGGQRQRMGIARALATRPELIVADEPTSALDLSIQAQVINLLLDIQQKLQLSYLFISHDLTLVQFVSNRLIVLYNGRIVEIAVTETLNEEAGILHHPYTTHLLETIPVPDPVRARRRKSSVCDASASVPVSGDRGCSYAPFCRECSDECLEKMPALKESGSGCLIACHKRQ